MPRAWGKDVSYWNGAIDPAINEIAEDFMIFRTGYGIRKDKKQHIYYPISLINPVRGAYHYHSSAVEWKREADFYLEIMDGRDWHFNMLDLERAFNNMSRSFVAGGGKWLEYVQKYTGNKKTIFYTNLDVYNNVLMKNADWMLDYDFMLAQYPWYRTWNQWLEKVTTDERKKPRLTRDKHPVSIWQYSADGNRRGKKAGVGVRDVDLDVYMGTLAQMKVWCGVDTTPAPIPPEGKTLYPYLEELDVYLREQGYNGSHLIKL